MAPRVVSILFQTLGSLRRRSSAAAAAEIGGALKTFGADSTRVGSLVSSSGGVISKALKPSAWAG